MWNIISFQSLFDGELSYYWLLEQEKVISISHYVPNYPERTGEADSFLKSIRGIYYRGIYYRGIYYGAFNPTAAFSVTVLQTWHQLWIRGLSADLSQSSFHSTLALFRPGCTSKHASDASWSSCWHAAASWSPWTRGTSAVHATVICTSCDHDLAHHHSSNAHSRGNSRHLNSYILSCLVRKGSYWCVFV